jgi:hypothetical protein
MGHSLQPKIAALAAGHLRTSGRSERIKLLTSGALASLLPFAAFTRQKKSVAAIASAFYKLPIFVCGRSEHQVPAPITKKLEHYIKNQSVFKAGTLLRQLSKLITLICKIRC